MLPCTQNCHLNANSTHRAPNPPTPGPNAPVFFDANMSTPRVGKRVYYIHIGPFPSDI